MPDSTPHTTPPRFKRNDRRTAHRTSNRDDAHGGERTTFPKNERIELTIESIGFEGKSVARSDGLVYFVESGVPGDRVIAEVRRKKKSYAEAVIVEVLERSPARIDARCSHFGLCGGCKWQHLDYAEQLRWKTQHVRDAFERTAKIPVGMLYDMLPATEQFRYRNKMEFSFGDSRWATSEEIRAADQAGTTLERSFALGLHIPGRYDKVLDVDECHLQHPAGNRIVAAVRSAAKARGCDVYQTRTHEGFLRNLVIRRSSATGELMVILVTSPVAYRSPDSTASSREADESLLAWLESDFPKEFPEVTTLVHAVTSSKGTVAAGEPRVLLGSGFITEEILGVRFRVSPFSFFQTNTTQANTLFRIALDYAFRGLQEHEAARTTVWDLYCGAGSITLPAARRAGVVAGIEISESSIADARNNAASNGITNVDFYAEDMQKAVKAQLLERLPKPDVVIVDPPRAGLHPDVVRNLAAIAAPVLVYVSCNPATQARDCALLGDVYNAYDVESVQPVDMFPHTYHIESVARLVRKA
jgi:23S rRNA (uracil1939-C5)-methyltransferase